MTSRSSIALSILLACSFTAALAAEGVASGPCPSVPDRTALNAERTRIKKVDSELKKRNDALILRGPLAEGTERPEADAYNAEVAALKADTEANDRAWEAYEQRKRAADNQAREAVRCGRVKIADHAASAASK